MTTKFSPALTDVVSAAEKVTAVLRQMSATVSATAAPDRTELVVVFVCVCVLSADEK